MDSFGSQIAPGNVLHAAGSLDGGFRAIDVFETREAADQVAEMVAQAAQVAGLAAPNGVGVRDPQPAACLTRPAGTAR